MYMYSRIFHKRHAPAVICVYINTKNEYPSILVFWKICKNAYSIFMHTFVPRHCSDFVIVLWAGSANRLPVSFDYNASLPFVEYITCSVAVFRYNPDRSNFGKIFKGYWCSRYDAASPIGRFHLVWVWGNFLDNSTYTVGKFFVAGLIVRSN